MQIKFKNVSYIYSKKTAFESQALNNVNLDLNNHFYAGIIGQTGSGKSTLIQHINGLVLPSEGSVSIDNYSLYTKGKKAFFIDNNKKQRKRFIKRKQFNIKDLRKKVGLVFQFPEYQLFSSTVLEDVMFGPLNYKVDKKEAEKLAKDALNSVGISEDFYNKNPFELSGGQKRKVAIAGILALNPDLLIFDEPTAGLDYDGETIMMELFNNLYKQGKSIIIVTHNMEIVLKYVNDVILLDKGKLVGVYKPIDLFTNKEIIDKTAIDIPIIFKFALDLKSKGYNLDLKNINDCESLVKEIRRNYHV